VASILKIGDKWRVQIRRKGHPSIARTFDKKTHAVEWARNTDQSIRAGEFDDDKRLANITISDLFKTYEEKVAVKKAFGKSKSGAIDMIKRDLGTTSLANLDADAIMEYAKKRSGKGAGGVTVNLELAYLSHALRIAPTILKIPFKGRPIEEARPMLKFLDLVGKSQERDRRPTEEELNAICGWFDAKSRQRIPMSDIIRFAVATTMRASEITSLRWDDLDETDRTVLIRDRKHPQEKIGNNQTVPLLADAFVIAMRQPRKSDLIFPYNSASFSSLFPRACNDLKIIDLRFHDLRHHGISLLFEQGYRIEQVALVSGHRDWKMLRRYTHVRAKDLHRGLTLAVSNASK